MSGGLTRAQRDFLTDLSEGPAFRLNGATRAMAERLRLRRLVALKPETSNLYEMWSITSAGRAALQAQPAP